MARENIYDEETCRDDSARSLIVRRKNGTFEKKKSGESSLDARPDDEYRV